LDNAPFLKATVRISHLLKNPVEVSVCIHHPTSNNRFKCVPFPNFSKSSWLLIFVQLSCTFRRDLLTFARFNLRIFVAVIFLLPDHTSTDLINLKAEGAP